MLHSIAGAAGPAAGASVYARILLLSTGVALGCWSIMRLRERHLLISISAFFIATGLGLVRQGVANSPEDVNEVLKLGFFHLYGPINDYVQCVQP